MYQTLRVTNQQRKKWRWSTSALSVSLSDYLSIRILYFLTPCFNETSWWWSSVSNFIFCHITVSKQPITYPQFISPHRLSLSLTTNMFRKSPTYGGNVSKSLEESLAWLNMRTFIIDNYLVSPQSITWVCLLH